MLAVWTTVVPNTEIMPVCTCTHSASESAVRYSPLLGASVTQGIGGCRIYTEYLLHCCCTCRGAEGTTDYVLSKSRTFCHMPIYEDLQVMLRAHLWKYHTGTCIIPECTYNWKENLVGRQFTIYVFERKESKFLETYFRKHASVIRSITMLSWNAILLNYFYFLPPGSFLPSAWSDTKYLVYVIIHVCLIHVPGT